MREQGRVRRWDTAKGFGFIEGERSGSVFFHIRDFRGSTSPVEGLRVSYEEIQVGGKGPRAMDVRPLLEAAPRPASIAAAPQRTGSRRAAAHGRRATPRAEPDAPTGAGLATGLMLAWLVLLAWGAWSQRLPWWLLGALAALNLVTYAAYAVDKSAARRGAWRTPEQHLHLLALLGGWPAAWWAQQRLRHKSSKLEFRRVYWATLVLNCAALVFLLGQPSLLANVLP